MQLIDLNECCSHATSAAYVKCAIQCGNWLHIKVISNELGLYQRQSSAFSFCSGDLQQSINYFCLTQLESWLLTADSCADLIKISNSSVSAIVGQISFRSTDL